MDAQLLSPSSAGTEASVYTSFAGLNQLKALAAQRGNAALKQVAQQFEAVFTQMLLKSMRQASFGGGIFDSQESDTYRGLFDQQLALTLATHGNGLGIAAMIERQLGGTRADASGTAADASALRVDGQTMVLPAARDARLRPAAALQGISVASTMAEPVAKAAPASHGDSMLSSIGDGLGAAARATMEVLPSGPRAFVKALAPYAEAAARKLGVSPRALLAQAALETDWGAHMPRQADGASSYNLFGIKAGDSWNGPAVHVPTLEYEGGVAVRKLDSFRAYASPAESFMDYARVLAGSPRYAAALGQGENVRGFARALQQGGYATDPEYAEKLVRLADSAPMRAALDALKHLLPVPLKAP